MAAIHWGTNSPKELDDDDAWVGGAAPGAGDDGIFTGEYQGAATAPAAQMTCDNIYVGPAYNAGNGGSPGNMGGSGTELDLLTGNIHYAGSCAAAYFTGSCDRVIAAHTKMQENALALSVTATGTGESLEHVNGRVDIVGGSFQNVHVDRASNRNPILVANSGSIVGFMHMNGGIYRGDVLPSTESKSIMNGSSMAIDSVTVLSDMFISNSTVTVTGTSAIVINDMVIGAGGFLDLSNHQGAIAVSGTIRIMSRGSVNLNSGKPITNSGVIILSRSGHLERFSDDLSVVHLP